LVVLLIGCARKGIFFQPIGGATGIWVVHVVGVELLCSLLGRRFAGARVANLRNVGCFLRLLISTDQCKQSDCFAVCSPPRCINGNSKPLGNLTKWWGVGWGEKCCDQQGGSNNPCNLQSGKILLCLVNHSCRNCETKFWQATHK